MITWEATKQSIYCSSMLYNARPIDLVNNLTKKIAINSLLWEQKRQKLKQNPEAVQQIKWINNEIPHNSEEKLNFIGDLLKLPEIIILTSLNNLSKIYSYFLFYHSRRLNNPTTNIFQFQPIRQSHQGRHGLPWQSFRWLECIVFVLIAWNALDSLVRKCPAPYSPAVCPAKSIGRFSLFSSRCVGRIFRPAKPYTMPFGLGRIASIRGVVDETRQSDGRPPGTVAARLACNMCKYRTVISKMSAFSSLVGRVPWAMATVFFSKMSLSASSESLIRARRFFSISGLRVFRGGEIDLKLIVLSTLRTLSWCTFIVHSVFWDIAAELLSVSEFGRRINFEWTLIKKWTKLSTTPPTRITIQLDCVYTVYCSIYEIMCKWTHAHYNPCHL